MTIYATITIDTDDDFLLKFMGRDPSFMIERETNKFPDWETLRAALIIAFEQAQFVSKHSHMPECNLTKWQDIKEWVLEELKIMKLSTDDEDNILRVGGNQSITITINQE